MARKHETLQSVDPDFTPQFPRFGQRFGQSAALYKICWNLNLTIKEYGSARLYNDWDRRGLWFSFETANGGVFRHRFDADSASALTEDDYKLLAVKIRMFKAC